MKYAIGSTITASVVLLFSLLMLNNAGLPVLELAQVRKVVIVILVFFLVKMSGCYFLSKYRKKIGLVEVSIIIDAIVGLCIVLVMQMIHSLMLSPRRYYRYDDMPLSQDGPDLNIALTILIVLFVLNQLAFLMGLIISWVKRKKI